MKALESMKQRKDVPRFELREEEEETITFYYSNTTVIYTTENGYPSLVEIACRTVTLTEMAIVEDTVKRLHDNGYNPVWIPFDPKETEVAHEMVFQS